MHIRPGLQATMPRHFASILTTSLIRASPYHRVLRPILAELWMRAGGRFSSQSSAFVSAE